MMNATRWAIAAITVVVVLGLVAAYVAFSGNPACESAKEAAKSLTTSSQPPMDLIVAILTHQHPLADPTLIAASAKDSKVVSAAYQKMIEDLATEQDYAKNAAIKEVVANDKTEVTASLKKEMEDLKKRVDQLQKELDEAKTPGDATPPAPPATVRSDKASTPPIPPASKK